MPNRAVIKIIQQRDFLIADPSHTIRDIARLMREYHDGAVLVVDDANHLMGICTERDIAFKVVAEGIDPDSTAVSAIMTPDPQTIGPDKPFGHALHLMFEGGFRHLPVVDDCGRPMGILSSRDALGLEMVSFKQELEQRETLAEIL